MITRLAGKGTGLGEALEKLELDPCATDAYKLVGPLRGSACGLHMKREYGAIGITHSLWKPLPGPLGDWVAMHDDEQLVLNAC